MTKLTAKRLSTFFTIIGIFAFGYPVLIFLFTDLGFMEMIYSYPLNWIVAMFSSAMSLHIDHKYG